MEQGRLLELVALGRPLGECLTAMTAAVERLQPGARACILLADAERSIFQLSYAASIPSSFGLGIKDAPISDLAIGTCGEAVHTGQPVTCPDIANDNRWSRPWRELCVKHGVLASHSEPVTGADGGCLGSLMLCFGEAREPTAWERRVAAFAVRVAGIAIDRDRAGQALREGERRLAVELADAHLLQRLSAILIQEGDTDALCRQIVDAAAAMMRSDAASMQMLHPERGELRLLAWTGFHPASAAFWEWVRVDSESTCGASLGSGQRVVVSDVEACASMAGTADLAAYRRSGIRAVQSTPLVSRTGGRLLGMISTHWREPHEPHERDLRRLDVLARQAADVLERKRSEDELRRLNETLEARVAQAIADRDRTWNNAQDLLLVLDTAGIFRATNPAWARTLGWRPDEVAGRHVLDLVHPDDHALTLDTLKHATVAPLPTMENRYRHKDGSWRRISWVAAPEGELIYATGRDVTAEREAAATLARAQGAVAAGP